jgi:hypothetical protein
LLENDALLIAMKKLTIIILLILFSAEVKAQQWNEFKMDSVLTVLLPEDYKVMDTLGQHLVRAAVENGIIILSVLTHEGKMAISMRDAGELITYYRDMSQGLIHAQGGELMSDTIVEKNGLKLIQFSFRALSGEERQLRHCVAAFVKNKTYVLSFWELESMTNEMSEVRQTVLGSFQLNENVLPSDQQPVDKMERSLSYRIGYRIGQLIAPFTLLGVIIILVILIRKKMKRKA